MLRTGQPSVENENNEGSIHLSVNTTTPLACSILHICA